MAELKTKKQEIFDYVFNMLGGGMIDVELDPDHYETALTKALTRFRQRSDNSVEESYMFMPTVIDQNAYTLPKEVIEVRRLFRRSIGSRTGGGGGGTTTTIHQPKEELPLKWEIPHMLTDKMVRDTVIGLWTGLRLE